jgi:hypothetical protein
MTSSTIVLLHRNKQIFGSRPRLRWLQRVYCCAAALGR